VNGILYFPISELPGDRKFVFCYSPGYSSVVFRIPKKEYQTLSIELLPDKMQNVSLHGQSLAQILHIRGKANPKRFLPKVVPRPKRQQPHPQPHHHGKNQNPSIFHYSPPNRKSNPNPIQNAQPQPKPQPNPNPIKNPQPQPQPQPNQNQNLDQVQVVTYSLPRYWGLTPRIFSDR
jgi:hypothetical protein